MRYILADMFETHLDMERYDPVETLFRVGYRVAMFVINVLVLNKVLDGLDYRGFKTKHNRGETMIRNYIQKYLREKIVVNGRKEYQIVKGIRKAREVLIKPYLKEAIELGLDRDGVLNYLIAHDVFIIRELYSGGDRPYAGLNYFSKKCFEGKNFDILRKELFIDPLIRRLEDEGVMIPGIGDQQINKEELLQLLDKVFFS